MASSAPDPGAEALLAQVKHLADAGGVLTPSTTAPMTSMLHNLPKTAMRDHAKAARDLKDDALAALQSAGEPARPADAARAVGAPRAERSHDPHPAGTTAVLTAFQET